MQEPPIPLPSGLLPHLMERRAGSELGLEPNCFAVLEPMACQASGSILSACPVPVRFMLSMFGGWLPMRTPEPQEVQSCLLCKRKRLEVMQRAAQQLSQTRKVKCINNSTVNKTHRCRLFGLSGLSAVTSLPSTCFCSFCTLESVSGSTTTCSASSNFVGNGDL